MRLTLLLLLMVICGSGLLAQRIHDETTRGGNAAVITHPEGMPLVQPFDLKETHPSRHTGVMSIEFDVMFPGNYVIEAVGPHGKSIESISSGFYQPGKYRITWMVSPGSHGIYMYFQDQEGMPHFHRLLMIKY